MKPTNPSEINTSRLSGLFGTPSSNPSTTKPTPEPKKNPFSRANTWTERCTATSKQSGERCKRRPHPGSNVCVIHGGGSPQAKRSARQRLNDLLDPALDALQTVLKDGIDKGDTPSVIRAALGILDRCGFNPSQTIEITGKDGGAIEIEASAKPINVESLPVWARKLILVVVSGGQISQELESKLKEEMDGLDLSMLDIASTNKPIDVESKIVREIGAGVVRGDSDE